MRLCVHQVQQHTSAGDYVVIFEADVTVTENSNVSVGIESVEPADIEPGLVEEAMQAIKRGAARALKPLRQGAHIQVLKLYLHASDFKLRRFEEFTAIELEKLLSRPQASTR